MGRKARIISPTLMKTPFLIPIVKIALSFEETWGEGGEKAKKEVAAGCS
jgi:hypothetical protein